jgi:predicted RNA-binding Zn ribbon-like protein
MSRMGPSEPRPVGLAPRISVDQLLWVANTRHGPGGHWFARVIEDMGDHDHLLEPGDAVDYLERHHVPLPSEPPSDAQLQSLAEIREMIRGLLDPARPAWSDAALAILRSTRFAADADANIRAVGVGWDGLIGDLMLPLIELVEQRQRLRMCGNPHCRLVFLDQSKNGSRRWCDTSGCGNRDRVARYRRSGARDRARSSGVETA